MKKELNKTKGVFVKNSKMSLARSTTALSCLIGSLIISSESVNATGTTTSGSLTVSGSVATSCTISGATMTFDPYDGNLQSKTVDIITNCTNGATYSISFATSPDDNPKYYLVRSPGGSSSTPSDRLEVTFKNTDGATMTNTSATITGTGTGLPATAGTITGTMAASQTGKTAGSYSKTMTLNIVY